MSNNLVTHFQSFLQYFFIIKRNKNKAKNLIYLLIFGSNFQLFMNHIKSFTSIHNSMYFESNSFGLFRVFFDSFGH